MQQQNQMPQQPMPQQPMQQQPQMPQAPMPQQQMTPAMEYLAKAQQILPAVQEKNPYLKEQVGHVIFEYVRNIIGSEKAPKITGMLIELPVPQIQQYMQSYEALQHRVHEANNLLMGGQPGQEGQQ